MPTQSGVSHEIHSRHNVLVVDDYTDTREAIVTLLQAMGFDVVGAASGPEALDMLQAGLRPCVILLDVRMPGMDGWTVWERMKAHPEVVKTPVVILSGDVADDARAKKVGIREFLLKPIDGPDVVAAVDRHCERQRAPAQFTAGSTLRA
jgi:CheY-like chemotaxis protein